MRGGILATGILLLIFGMFFYFTGNNMIQEIEAYDVYDIPISELLKTLSQDVRRQYETGQSMVMFGGILGIVGFILCIAGIAVPGKKSESIEKTPSNEKSSKSERRCPSCGRAIPDGAILCPFCGKKFANHFEEEEKPLEKLPQKEERPVETVEEELKEGVKDETTKEDKIEEPKQKEGKVAKKQEIQKSKFCFECGAKLEDSPKFCPMCGTNQEES
jgi:RNA polymerase subunit RPABC4/transcription elongation factor Spt4